MITVLSAQNDFRPIDVPLEIWLPHRYPHEPPFFFVRLDLLPPQVPPIIIRLTSISDARGIISFPGSFNTLVDAIRELQNEFSAELPIVSAPPTYNVVAAASPQQALADLAQPVPASNPAKRLEEAKTRFITKINRALEEGCGDKLNSGQGLLAQETNTRLLQNRKDREREKLALSNEISLINKELEALSRRQEYLESWIGQSESLDSIDKVLIAKDERTVQLADLLAFEAALNDAIFGVMKKVLSGEPGLTLAAGLRLIRDLSRRHFLAKVHIKKIVNK